MKLPISAVIITFNEEKNIQKCLESLSGWVDEIVVLDSFSTDHTEEICKKYNVKFHQQKWMGYAQQKNIANNYASNDWIISLDADEVVSPTLQNSIQEACQKGLRGVYRLRRLTNFCGSWIRHCGWYPDAKVRIFNKKDCEWIGEFVHETLKYPSAYSPLTLNGDILHYSFHTISDYVKQADNFSSLAAKSLHAKGRKANMIKILFSPSLKFFSEYILKRGFLDGKAGFIVSTCSSYSVFLKLIKLMELQKKLQNKD